MANFMLGIFAALFGGVWGKILVINSCTFPESRRFCIFCKQCSSNSTRLKAIMPFLELFGKTSICSKRPRWLFVAVEIFMAALLLAILSFYPILGQNGDFILGASWEIFRGFYLFSFLSILVLCSIIDAYHMIIPDPISLPGIALGIFLSIFHPEVSIKSSLLGGLFGFGLIFFLGYAYEFFKKEEGLGLGDAKLLGLIGSWLGYPSILPTLLYGCWLGLFGALALRIADKKWPTLLPFGPFLSLGSLLYLFFPLGIF